MASDDSLNSINQTFTSDFGIDDNQVSMIALEADLETLQSEGLQIFQSEVQEQEQISPIDALNVRESRLEILHTKKACVYNLFLELAHSTEEAEILRIQEDLEPAQEELGSYSLNNIKSIMDDIEELESVVLDESQPSTELLQRRQELGEFCLCAARWKSVKAAMVAEDYDPSDPVQKSQLQNLQDIVQELSFRAVVWKFFELHQLESELLNGYHKDNPGIDHTQIDQQLINTRSELEEMSPDAARYTEKKVAEYTAKLETSMDATERTTAEAAVRKSEDMYGKLCTIATKHTSQKLMNVEDKQLNADDDDSLGDQNFSYELREDLIKFSVLATTFTDKKVVFLKDLLSQNKELTRKQRSRLRQELKMALRNLAYSSCEMLLLKHTQTDDLRDSIDQQPGEEDLAARESLAKLNEELILLHRTYGKLHRKWMHDMQQEEEYGHAAADSDFYKFVIQKLRRVLGFTEAKPVVLTAELFDMEASCVAEALGQTREKFTHMLRY